MPSRSGESPSPAPVPSATELAQPTEKVSGNGDLVASETPSAEAPPPEAKKGIEANKAYVTIAVASLTKALEAGGVLDKLLDKKEDEALHRKLLNPKTALHLQLKTPVSANASNLEVLEYTTDLNIDEVGTGSGTLEIEAERFLEKFFAGLHTAGRIDDSEYQRLSGRLNHALTNQELAITVKEPPLVAQRVRSSTDKTQSSQLRVEDVSTDQGGWDPRFVLRLPHQKPGTGSYKTQKDELLHMPSVQVESVKLV